MTGKVEAASPASLPGPLRLADGSQIAVIGSGPAGSLFAYFALDMAARIDLKIGVDIYEPRQFDEPGPQGCNMCGGIISESLVQNLAAEGISLPSSVVQRGIDSYVLHMDVGTVKIETPLRERRIGAVHRGGGPRDVAIQRWWSFDQHLLRCAQAKGARLLPSRVDTVALADGRPVVKSRDGVFRQYDLLVGAVGVNSSTLTLFEALGIGYKQPPTTKTLIREYRLGHDAISAALGTSMHVFLLDIPRLKFAAVIPKGDYVTICLIGERVDGALIDRFVAAPEVKACMPAGWNPAEPSCQCLPRMNMGGVKKPYADGFVFIGDCGVSRLYKDGIGAAYQTAKAAARTAVFDGISEAAFARRYGGVCRHIVADNRIARLAFVLIDVARHVKRLRLGLLRMTRAEQFDIAGPRQRASRILWDLFSGSARYKIVFKRMLHPAFVCRFLWSVATTWRQEKMAT